MTDVKILVGESNINLVKLTDSNLWMEPTTTKSDADFWIERFKSQKVPFVLAQYDTELMNEKKEKMYRRVYGLFIDMKAWERKNDDTQQAN